MICKACGRSTTNESANFCDYCGTSFRENTPIVQNASNPYNGGSMGEQQMMYGTENENNEKPISFGNWIGTMLLPFIPIVGPLIYFVMMLVWAFSSETSKSKKNWARASLIVMVVSIVMLVVFFASAMTELMNSGFNIEDYMGQYY